MTAFELGDDAAELLQELRSIAPDMLEGCNRRIILPQKLGDLEKPEYVENIQKIIQRLNKHISMLNTGLVSEAEYERKKAEILSSI